MLTLSTISTTSELLKQKTDQVPAKTSFYSAIVAIATQAVSSGFAAALLFFLAPFTLTPPLIFKKGRF